MEVWPLRRYIWFHYFSLYDMEMEAEKLFMHSYFEISQNIFEKKRVWSISHLDSFYCHIPFWNVQLSCKTYHIFYIKSEFWRFRKKCKVMHKKKAYLHLYCYKFEKKVLKNSLIFYLILDSFWVMLDFKMCNRVKHSTFLFHKNEFWRLLEEKKITLNVCK